MMGGWSSDDFKMHMDEKETWGTHGTYFGRTRSHLDEMTHSCGPPDMDHSINILTWVYVHLLFVIKVRR